MTPEGRMRSELRVRRAHRFVRLEILFFACLALTIWAGKQIPWGAL